MDRNLLARATEGTDAPTPGYLYVDLVKAATANPTACQEMAQYLTRKLANKQNPNVKFKCCKVIGKLAEDVPRNQFRRCIAQDGQAVAAIKEAIQFRGPMDPVQGDAKNEKVRVAAREALDAVYKEAPSSEGGGGAAMASSAMSASYASAPHAAGGYAPGGGGGGGYPGANRMEGIGNPNYSDPRNDPRYNGQSSSFQEAMKEAGEVVKGMIMDPLARNVGPQYNQDVPSRGHSGNLPGYGNRGGPPPGSAELSSRTGGQWTMASNRGPSAVTGGPTTNEYYKERDTGFNSWNNSAGTSATAGVPGGSWGAAAPTSVAGQAREPAYGTPSVTINHNPAAAVNSTTGATSDGTYEKNLILELCPPGGVKPVPPVDKLANFARSVSSLNSELICPVLLDFLEEGQPWVIRAKALCVMETAIQNGIVADGTNPYKTFFHACSGEIQPLAAHPRAAIKDPAKRVLLLLGITPGPGAEAPPPASAPPPPPAVEAPNLLDFGDETVDAPPAQPAQPPPPPPSEAPPPPPPAAAAPPATDPPVASSGGGGGGGDMFGGMTVKGAAPAPQAPAPAPPAVAPPAAAPAADNLLDFSASDAFAPATAPAASAAKADNTGAAAATGMFGDLSIKEEKKKEDNDAAEPAAVPASGSAFGFINSDSTAAAGATPAAAPAAAASKPESFDPLQNLGGGTAAPAAASNPTMSPTGSGKQTLSLSTEQMQAMAYQQMMMQQAQMQQMQQMQMAAMMAQQHAQSSQRASMTGMPAPPMPMQFRQSSGSGVPSPYQQARPIKKDDQKFDFVKDHMLQTKK